MNKVFLHPTVKIFNTIEITLPFVLVMLLFMACGNDSATTSTTSTSPVQSDSPKEKESEEATKKKSIVFFGNSLTAGYGLDPEQSFVYLIQQRLEEVGLPYQTVNAGLSGETTAGGNSRIDWILRQPIDVFVLELGGNDGLRGIDPTASFKNLQSIINKVKDKYPEAKILLAGMEAPPNMGTKFTSEFREMYPKLAQVNETQLIPFLLDKVGGIPELNQPDGIHPTAKGNEIIAETIWKYLQPML